ncbi:MAG TPA: hypothetical protein VIF62_38175, partial [Labilithrix sp.]
VPALLRLAFACALLAACTPSIGDKCVLSTDCSPRGDRLCDTSQPDGYCTIFNCAGDGCPDLAACVLFNASVPGCGYSDRTGGGGSRLGQSFCIARCHSDGDCRAGYVCVDPRRQPWGAIILDDDQTQLTCMPRPPGWSDDGGLGEDASVSSAPVCGPTGPADAGYIDAAPPRVFGDAGIADASDGG